ncbi:lytic transglycosylase domain-containing protein [Bordetella hinzii]|uniref:lytic transglycosylase domain-containing protein n=1 Tax=Bordetella hinzii TaxID=103855 RepID=UPI0039FB99F8
MAKDPYADLFRFVAQAESGGRDYDAAGRVITSPKGAKGMMQVMDATNLDPGYGVTPAQDDSLAERTRVGQDYLKAMIGNYGGDLIKGLAAYNAGPGNVDRALAAAQQAGDPNWMKYLPKPQETLPYVQKIVANMGSQPGTLDRIASAVLPSAQAQQAPDKLASDPLFQMLAGSPQGSSAPSEKLSADPVWQMLNEGPKVSESRSPDGALRVEMGGTAPEEQRSGVLGAIESLGAGARNLASGIQQGLGDIPAGVGQSGVHQGQQILQQMDDLLGTNLAAQAEQNVAARDAEVAAREASYQAATPGSTMAGIGRLGGNLAFSLAGGPAAAAAPIATTAQAAQRLIPFAPGVARMLGGAAGGALQAAGYGAAAPVAIGDYGQQSTQNARLGAMVGAGAPVVGAGAQAIGRGIGSLFGANLSPEVAQLAQKAQAQGINIRPDQLVNSKPTNVLSAALDYLPFSGKGASLASQQKQFNQAVARTVGESTDNVSKALSQAETRLGAEFDRVLKNTAVKADDQFQADLGRILGDARNELTDQQFGVVSRQVENILGKVKPGDLIDADAAYNIKKGLDRISKGQDSSLAYYGREIRDSLMEALNRSLPDGGKSFATTRKQWANLSELGKILPRGAEGDVSPARLANARGIRSNDLGELGDIAAQFLKGRVGDSGTAQRAGVYSLLGTGAYIDPTSAAVGLTLGRLLNTGMGSPGLASLMAKRAMSAPAALQGAAGLPGPLTNTGGIGRLLYPAINVGGVPLMRPVPSSR